MWKCVEPVNVMADHSTGLTLTEIVAWYVIAATENAGCNFSFMLVLRRRHEGLDEWLQPVVDADLISNPYFKFGADAAALCW